MLSHRLTRKGSLRQTVSEKKILIISVSAGAGHVRAAEAVRAGLEIAAPDVSVSNIDCLQYTPFTFRKLYAGSYLSMAKRVPFLWGLIYNQAGREAPASSAAKFRRFVEKVNTRAIVRYVRDFSPDQIICTHFLPAVVLSRLKAKGALDVPVSTVVTDFDVHTFWVHENIDRYYVGNEEVRFVLRMKGIPEERILVTGIPVHPAFAQHGNGRRLFSELSLDPEIPTVLVTAGGYGVGAVEDAVVAIMNSARPLQVLVVAGRNERLAKRLSRLNPPDGVQLRSFGYVDNMHELMDIADVAVTKAGGLTCAECVAKALPVLIVSAIPGQEERNSDFLLESGAALRVRSLESLTFKLQQLTQDSGTLRCENVLRRAYIVTDQKPRRMNGTQ